MTTKDPLKSANDFATQFISWFNGASGLGGKISDSRRRERMILSNAKERTDRNLSALPSTKSTELIDKAKDAALVEYHKDPRSISFSAVTDQDPQMNNLAKWLTAIVHYRMTAIDCFPFLAWHESSLKAGYTDGMEAAMVYWDKQSWKDTKTVYTDKLQGMEVDKEIYNQAKAIWPDMMASDPTIPPFDSVFTKETITEEVVCKDTWWIRQLLPGENVFWDFKAPYMNVNAGQNCLVKIAMTVDEVMAKMEAGIFDKLPREEVEKYQTLQGTTSPATDKTAFAPTQSHDLGTSNTVEVWFFWEKIKFRWMVSFSLEGKKALTEKVKPSDDIFFNGRRVNIIPVAIGYFDKYLHENMGRSLPQVIAPIEDQYIDHINNVNDIAKNIARGGRIRVTPGSDVDLDAVMNGGMFSASQGDVEFVQYNAGIMEAMRSSDMHSAAMNAIAPVGVSATNLAPKGTSKTLGQSQMVQGTTDTKRYVQLMVRNQTFFRLIMWIIAQLEFAYETDNKVLQIAAAQVPDFKIPVTIDPKTGKGNIDVSKLDFDINVQINAGLGEMVDSEKFQNTMQLAQICKQIGVMLDPMITAELLASQVGYSLQRFNPQPPPSDLPPPKLDNKLTVTAGWLDLPQDVQGMLIELWRSGKMGTESKIDGQINEMMHSQFAQQQAANNSHVMAQDPMGMEGGQFGQG